MTLTQRNDLGQTLRFDGANESLGVGVQNRTILVADVPRAQCDEHGVVQIAVPWSDPKSRFTALFEALREKLF
jgi:hypothetical protein